MPGHSADKPNARTEAALQRLDKAMREVEADIEANHGVYPFNHGRVTQSELCRRADVKKATLQNPVHKDTTRVDIMAWLDQLAARLSQTRDGTRERVTVVADHLAAQVQQLTLAHQAVQEQLALAEERIAQLQDELSRLRVGTGA
jgi:chromosome segregation ATPase